MPYPESGTLTTDTRSDPQDSTSWDTQAEWNAYQSKDGIEVKSDGTIVLKWS